MFPRYLPPRGPETDRQTDKEVGRQTGRCYPTYCHPSSPTLVGVRPLPHRQAYTRLFSPDSLQPCTSTQCPWCAPSPFPPPAALPPGGLFFTDLPPPRCIPDPVLSGVRRGQCVNQRGDASWSAVEPRPIRRTARARRGGVSPVIFRAPDFRGEPLICHFSLKSSEVKQSEAAERAQLIHEGWGFHTKEGWSLPCVDVSMAAFSLFLSDWGEIRNA